MRGWRGNPPCSGALRPAGLRSSRRTRWGGACRGSPPRNRRWSAAGRASTGRRPHPAALARSAGPGRAGCWPSAGSPACRPRGRAARTAAWRCRHRRESVRWRLRPRGRCRRRARRPAPARAGRIRRDPGFRASNRAWSAWCGPKKSVRSMGRPFLDDLSARQRARCRMARCGAERAAANDNRRSSWNRQP